jgi:exodeoxyribonuclease V beta subunit
MYRSHYVLQYHIYVAALHRFLKIRLPGYEYEPHMGGVCYAFLRAAGRPDGGGWFCDLPPRTMIDALDALLDCVPLGPVAEVRV